MIVINSELREKIREITVIYPWSVPQAQAKVRAVMTFFDFATMEEAAELLLGKRPGAVICDGCRVLGVHEHRCHGPLAKVNDRPVHQHCHCWGVSAGGHVSAGQTSSEAALRETQEELGLEFDPSILEHVYTTRSENVVEEAGLVNKEFNYIYVIRAPVRIEQIKKQALEVADVHFLSPEEFEKWVNGQGEKMTPHHEEYKILIKYLNHENF